MHNIVFISYQEPNAEDNWLKLKERFPDAQRLHGIVGIHNAHRQAANIFYTPFLKSMLSVANVKQHCSGQNHFWVVDGDSIISDDFTFDVPSQLIRDGVYVYKALNPVNGLTYGYGGIKLLPIEQTANMNINNVDMTTSISKNFFPVNQVASTTNFNTDPFNTWKSAFRECVKLSSKIIEEQVDIETDQRLDAWCTIGNDKLYGNYCINGAIEGRVYGRTNRGNIDALKLINNFSWLENKFKELYD